MLCALKQFFTELCQFTITSKDTDLIDRTDRAGTKHTYVRLAIIIHCLFFSHFLNLNTLKAIHHGLVRVGVA